MIVIDSIWEQGADLVWISVTCNHGSCRNICIPNAKAQENWNAKTTDSPSENLGSELSLFGFKPECPEYPGLSQHMTNRIWATSDEFLLQPKYA